MAKGRLVIRDKLPPGAEIIGAENSGVTAAPAAVPGGSGRAGLPANAEIIGSGETTPLEGVSNTLDRVVQGARNLFTGEDRIAPEDVGRGEVRLPSPTIGERVFGEDADRSGLTFDQLTKVSTVLAMVPGEKAKADIIKQIVPGTESRIDNFGNVLIKFPQGSDFEFLNRPGLTLNDLDETVGQLIQFLPAGRVLRGATAVPRTLAVGTASGATSVAQDIGATAAGSEQPIDIARMALAAGGGFLGEAAAPALRSMVNFARGRQNLTVNEVAGLAERAGLDPRIVTADFAKTFNDVLTRAGRRQLRADLQATRGAGGAPQSATEATGRALSEEFDVPLTRGQATQDFRQVAREEGLLASERPGGERLRRFRGAEPGAAPTAQIPSVQRATERIAQQGLPSEALDTRLVAGSTREALAARAAVAGREVDRAYELARNKNASISGSSARDLLRFVDNAVVAADDQLDELTPAASKARRAVFEMVPTLPQAPRRQVGFLAPGDDPPPPILRRVTLKQLERTRRRINNQFDKVANPGDRRLLSLIKRSFDRWVDDAFDNALFTGDPEALGLLKNARLARQQFGELFEQRAQSDSAGRIIERMLDDPDITTHELNQWMFGSSKVGQSKDAIRLVRRLSNVFGADSAEIGAMRQASVHSLFFNSRTGQPLVGGPSVGEGFQRMRSNLDEFLDGAGREWAETLHTPQQLAELRRFRQLIDRFVPPKKATNPSGTGFFIQRAVEQQLENLMAVFGMSAGGPAGGAVARSSVQAVGNIRSRRQAQQAISQAFTSVDRPPAIALGPALAVQLRDQEREQGPEVPF